MGNTRDQSPQSGPLFGDVLRRLRRAAGLTQEELAERANLSPRGLSDLERNVIRFPRRETVLALIEALALSPEDAATLRAAARPRIAGGSPSVLPAHAGGVVQPAPSSLQTFLIADVRGYTTYTQERGDEAGAELAMRFAQVAREVMETGGGRILELRGDEALAVFSSARSALHAGVELQAQLATAAQEDPDHPIHCGIGLDAGEAVTVEGGYRGLTLNLAARLCSLAGAGEVLTSETVVGLAHTVEDLAYTDRGLVSLKGFARPVRVLQVRSRTTPSPRVPDAHAAPVTAQTLSRPGIAPGQVLPIGGFLGALPSGQLVAREAEVRTLTAALDTVAGGVGSLVLLAGEAGIGKTRLAQEVTLAARDRGFLVASGRCYEPQQAVAYYPILEALGTAYAAAPAELQEQLAHRCPDVMRLVPNGPGSSASSAPETASLGGPGGHGDQQRLFWQVTGFVQALADLWPVAILLDDLHWADQASLDLLLHLARHTRTSRILLLGTYRDDEVWSQQPLEAALRDLARDQLHERIPVRRLSIESTRTLIAATVDVADISDAFTQALYARTEGNPFFTRQMVRALVERGDITTQTEALDQKLIQEMELPESVVSVIGQRLRHLSPKAQEVLHEASVLGQAFAFEDLHAMSGRSEAVVEDALDEGLVAGLVRELGHDRFGFQHALIQYALYRSLTDHKRRRLHRASGNAIERIPDRERAGRAAELAYHFLAAAEVPRALVYALQAGDQSEAVYAHTEAERHYRSSLEMARTLGDEQREGEALEKLGHVLWLLGRENEACEVFERAARRYATLGDLEGQLRAIARTLPIHGSRGTSEQGLARAQTLIEVAEATGGASALRGLAALYTGLAALYAKCGRFQDQLAAATRAEELARETRDDVLLVPALQWRALATANLGVEDPRPLFLDLVSLAERVGDKWVLSRALNNVAASLQFNGELARALPYLDRALEVAEQLGSPPEIALKLLNRAGHAFDLGEWRRAREDCMRATNLIERYDLRGDEWLATYPHVLLGTLDLAEGRTSAGERHLMEALALALHVGDLVAQRHVAWALAERDLLQGNAAVAYARLQPLLDRPGQQESDVERLLPLVAWAEAELGRPAEGKPIIAQAQARCTRFWQADVLRVQSMLHAREQRYDKAVRALEDSLALCRTMAYPYAEAKALYVYGQILIALGEVDQVRTRFEAALMICYRLGEGLYRPAIERALHDANALCAPASTQQSKQ